MPVRDRDQFDVLAVVIGGGDRVGYLPPLVAGEPFPWSITADLTARIYRLAGSAAL